MVSDAQKRANAKYARENVRSYTVKFYPADGALWDHLQQQPNKMGYVKSLIRKDRGIMEYTAMFENDTEHGLENFQQGFYAASAEEAARIALEDRSGWTSVTIDDEDGQCVAIGTPDCIALVESDDDGAYREIAYVEPSE